MLRWVVGLAALSVVGCATPPAGPASRASGDGLRLERVVMLMRHGVRPPTKAQVAPDGVAAQPWPAWPVDFGELTPHGAAGAKLVGQYDRAFYASRGLLPQAGCPAAGAVFIESSYKSRTLETGRNFAEGLAPGCGIDVVHPASEAADVLFHSLDTGKAPFDGARAHAAALEEMGPGGPQGLVDASRADLQLLDQVLGCCAPVFCARTAKPAGCSLADVPGALKANDDAGPDMEGPLGVASTLAQTLLLEYVEGKPMAEVGWGRVSRDQIERFLAFHTLKFRYEARTPYVAERAASGLARRMLAALEGQGGGDKLTVFAGHDTNIAELGGMLDLHWKAASYPADDPPPGGALGFELLRDAAGGQFVRAFYQAQSMDQLRDLAPLTLASPPDYAYIAIPGCGEVCPLAAFKALVEGKLNAPAA